VLVAVITSLTDTLSIVAENTPAPAFLLISKILVPFAVIYPFLIPIVVTSIFVPEPATNCIVPLIDFTFTE